MSPRVQYRTDRPSFAGVAIATGERANITRTGEREPISQLVRQLVYRRDNWTCQHCHAASNARDPHRRSGALHLDHVVPWSAGGSDRSDNLRTLCGPCNEARSNYVDQEHDQPTTPVVRICAPCLAATSRIVAQWCDQGLDRFDVYCGAHSHFSWAITGWKIL